ncbi:MAG: hypothetical protein LBK66_07715 [Spirochaetaceae bacterium]|nr:hypothetical protein [Spirochaetaceae bacterium]
MLSALSLLSAAGYRRYKILGSGFFRRLAVLLSLLCFFALSAALAIDAPLSQIPDDSALRRKLFEPWFTEIPSRVLARSAYLETLPGGERVEVRTELGINEFGIVLAREIAGGFPGWAQGSWVITRNTGNGRLTRARFFPRSDPYTYIQFRPLDENRGLLDVVAYDAYIAQSVIMPLNLERIITIPLQDTLDAANRQDILRYFEPHLENYANVRELISHIRQFLPKLSFADDGAINEDGSYVFISTLQPQTANPGLNCSGFAKWLIDGLLAPVTGKRLSISALKQPYGTRGSSFTAPYEASRDPFFGLDWIRNLAAAVNSTLKSPAFGVLDEIEVKESPFSQIILRSGRTSRISYSTGFLPDAGFDIKDLRALLFTLAINEPGTIYLGAVNNELPPKPRMRQYFHIAALFPYFDEHGTFHILVFESASETRFNSFIARYPNHYINLVRIPIENPPTSARQRVSHALRASSLPPLAGGGAAFESIAPASGFYIRSR